MSACGSLHHMFEDPLPEKPTLLESLSWSQIKPAKSIDHSSSSSSFTEIFGELHFKESPQQSPSSSSPSHVCTSSFAEIDHTKLSQKGVSGTFEINQTPSSSSAYVSISAPITNHANSHYKSSDSFSSLNSGSLQLCTEGLGFESSDDVEDLKTRVNECWKIQSDEKDGAKKYCVPSSEEDSNGECRNRSRVNEGKYPPPISCIGRAGKPWVSFRSYRKNGRFVLKELRIPTQELMLHAHREDGRLKLHFVQPGEEFLEEDDDDDDKEEEEEEEEEEEDYDDVEGIEEGEDGEKKIMTV